LGDETDDLLRNALRGLVGSDIRDESIFVLIDVDAANRIDRLTNGWHSLLHPQRFQGPRVGTAARPPELYPARGALAHGAMQLRTNVSRIPWNPTPNSAELRSAQGFEALPWRQARGSAQPCPKNR